jgi:hypothetical protein
VQALKQSESNHLKFVYQQEELVQALKQSESIT